MGHETVDEPHEASLTAEDTEAAATATTEREMHETTAVDATKEVHETVDDSRSASLTAGGSEAAATATTEREMHETTAVETSQQAAVVGILMHVAPKRGLGDVAIDSM